MENKTARVAFRLRPTTKESLEALAKKEDRTLSDYVNLILEKHVADNQTELPDHVRKKMKDRLKR